MWMSQLRIDECECECVCAAEDGISADSTIRGEKHGPAALTSEKDRMMEQNTMQQQVSEGQLVVVNDSGRKGLTSS